MVDGRSEGHEGEREKTELPIADSRTTRYVSHTSVTAADAAPNHVVACQSRERPARDLPSAARRHHLRALRYTLLTLPVDVPRPWVQACRDAHQSCIAARRLCLLSVANAV